MQKRLVLLPLLISYALSLSEPAFAQGMPATCGIAPAAADPAFVAWNRPGLASGTLVLGSAARMSLKSGVRFAESSARSIKPGTFGGSISLTVIQPGDYAIALSEGAWLDVVGGGKALASAAHRHGPACSTMRKIVTFRFSPGTYQVQVSGSPTASVTIEAIKAS